MKNIFHSDLPPRDGLVLQFSPTETSLVESLSISFHVHVVNPPTQQCKWLLGLMSEPTFFAPHFLQLLAPKIRHEAEKYLAHIFRKFPQIPSVVDGAQKFPALHCLTSRGSFHDNRFSVLKHLSFHTNRDNYWSNIQKKPRFSIHSKSRTVQLRSAFQSWCVFRRKFQGILERILFFFLYSIKVCER